jgi:glyoxylase-like metal-dependent hydrolase (beta-lactamase superfamily II)
MRRGIVLGVLIAVGGLLLAAAGSQGQPQDPKVVRMQSMGVRDNLYLLSGGGGNTAMLIADDGVVLIDTKLAGWGQPILDAIKRVTDLPVKMIINTHTHADHTGSNGEFPTAIDIVAHENTKANMERMDAFKGANAKFLPTKTYQTKMSLLDRVDRIDLYYFGAGHTNGDTIVVLPALRVAHVGDLFASKAAPFIDTINGGSGVALPQTLARAVTEIKNVDRVITGHTIPPPGAVAGRWTTWDDLREYADFNRDFLVAVQEALKAGKSADEAAASLRLPGKYKDYGMDRAKANIQAIYNELRK